MPSRIYSLWLQGEEAAPDLVKMNFDRWRNLNPEYEFVVYDETSTIRLLEGFGIDINGLTKQAISDILRVKILSEMGGIWVDASVYPSTGINEFVNRISKVSDIFAFYKPGPDRLIASWFLMSSKKNTLFSQLFREVVHYWGVNRTLYNGIPDDPVRFVSRENSVDCNEYPYFWFHYIFQYVVEGDKRLTRMFSKMPKISADMPHELQAYFLEVGEDYDVNRVREIITRTPVHKLNWRVCYPLDMLYSI
jgi:hypothetical protein